MFSNFLLLFGQLNLAFLFFEKEQKIIKKYNVLKTETVEIFKYEKNNNKYWNRAKLYNQVVSITLFITEIHYSGY